MIGEKQRNGICVCLCGMIVDREWLDCFIVTRGTLTFSCLQKQEISVCAVNIFSGHHVLST